MHSLIGRLSALRFVLIVILLGHVDGRADELTVRRDIAYRQGASRQWKLDLAMPSDLTGKPRPGIVVIHGGGWLEGDKSSFSTDKNRVPGNIIDFASLGFVAITINYRLSGEAPYPAAFEDCQTAVRWLRAHAREFNLDAGHIGAYGNSAGGHLALLLGLDDGAARARADDPYAQESSTVQAVVSDSGPVDLLYQHRQNRLQGVVSKFLGGPPEGDREATYRRASPRYAITPKAAPILLIYGASDEQVPVESADEFVLALARAGLKDVTYYRLAFVDHCPHSLVRIPSLQPAVNEFFVRTLLNHDTAQRIKRPAD
jgi:acetyl esterase/lipase